MKMKQKSRKQVPQIDERQQQFRLRSYEMSFWFVMGVLFISNLSNSWLSELISPDFWIFLAMFGGVAVNVCYASLKGAHPLVDERFGRQGKWGSWVIIAYSLFMLAATVAPDFYAGLIWKDFFARGGTGSMLVLALSLLSMGISIAYRLYLDQKEGEE